MNNTPNSGGRKKTTVSGSGTVKKTEQVHTSGPVGRKDGYSGKNTSRPNGQGQNPNQNRAGGSSLGLLGLLLGSGGSGLKRILTILVIVVAIVLLFRVCTGGCESRSILDLLFGNYGEESSVTWDGDGYDNPYYGGSSGSDSTGGNTGATGGTSFDSNDLLNLFLSDSYDETDNSAEEIVSSSSSTETAVTTVSNKARDKYTKLIGGGKDTVTLMVYMCGTDLESENGMGTADLNEMLHASIDDSKVNVIVETGGTKRWNNSVISNTTNQIYRVTSRGLQALEKNLGRKSMVDPNTLSDFIQYCASNYPADRYCLIFWDHGGGSLSGYGYDQYFSGSMTLDKVNSALKKGGVKFDFIGFDACLMATLETALVSEQYADYLLASEESEPGCGWYYTNWLTQLSKNTSVSTVELSRTIIDDFNNVCKKNYPGCNTTLSIVDLAEFAGTVPEPFAAFSKSVSGLLDNKEYKTVSDARSGAREFGKTSRINHVDLVDLANKIGTSEASSLVSALRGCIKYNRTSTSMSNSYGLSIYFPYSSFSGMNTAVKLYDNIGMDSGYTDCIKSFSSLAAGGQIATGGTTSSPIGSLLGGYSGSSGFSSGDMLEYLLDGYLGGGTGTSASSSSSGSLLGSLFGSALSGSYGGGSASGIDPTDYLSTILGGGSDSYSSWFDSGRALANKDYYTEHSLSTADMLLTEKNGASVLSLPAEKWDLVQSVQLNVFVDDGTGYVDLGMDNVYTFDSDRDLLIDWDHTWISINGHIVPYYMVNDSEDKGIRTTIGRVPAMLNDELVYVMIAFENENAYVLGAQRLYDHDETDTVAKGYLPINSGDTLTFVCDFYGYDGSYNASYLLADPLVVTGDLTVANLKIEGDRFVYCYCLTDIYGNEFWTASLVTD